LPISDKSEIGAASVGRPTFVPRRLPAEAAAKAGIYRLKSVISREILRLRYAN
jgi:hypothetical protein